MDSIIQGSEEWRQIRAGKVTGSRIGDVMAKGRGGGESTTRRNYLAQLAIETMTGSPIQETYYNSHMERGNELEAAAREAYEFVTGSEVVQIGFIDHPAIPRHGVSPDGLVGDDGMIQIKCPIPAIHINYMFAKVTPSEYVKQMQIEMSCAGRQWNDFVSYCPALPVELQLFIVREHRNQETISAMSAEVIRFLAEVDAMVKQLEALRR